MPDVARAEGRLENWKPQVETRDLVVETAHEDWKQEPEAEGHHEK